MKLFNWYVNKDNLLFNMVRLNVLLRQVRKKLLIKLYINRHEQNYYLW